MKWYIRIFLVIISALFFNLAHPNILAENGIAIFAYIALVPVFLLIRHSSFLFSLISGLLYGALSYGVLFSWIGAYSFYAMLIGTVAFSMIFAALFLLLKIADIVFI